LVLKMWKLRGPASWPVIGGLKPAPPSRRVSQRAATAKRAEDTGGKTAGATRDRRARLRRVDRPGGRSHRGCYLSVPFFSPGR
jgi:hypothetical protein